MEQDIKKLVLGDCEVTDSDCQVIADLVKVNDTIEELDLPKNTKSSKKYKITIDESAEEFEKAKTTINNIVKYYHDEVTQSDELHEECVVQVAYWWGWLEDEAHPERLQVKMYIPRESANQNVAIVGERNDEDQAVPSVVKLIEKLTDDEVDEMIPATDVDDSQCSLSRSWTYQFLRSPKESWKLSQHSTGANPGTSRCTYRQHR